MANIQISALGAVIKQAYENQDNTNPFTDAERIKLENILENDLPENHIIIGTADGFATSVPYEPANNWTETLLNLHQSGLTWMQIINHNLGYKPIIKIVRSNGEEVELYIKHLSDNAFVIKSLANVSGSVFVL